MVAWYWLLVAIVVTVFLTRILTNLALLVLFRRTDREEAKLSLFKVPDIRLADIDRVNPYFTIEGGMLSDGTVYGEVPPWISKVPEEVDWSISEDETLTHVEGDEFLGATGANPGGVSFDPGDSKFVPVKKSRRRWRR